jgi:beta-aspartyl-peptidase (threonine type)
VIAKMLLTLAAATFSISTTNAAGIVLAIHGGAGALKRENLSAAQEIEIRADLERALRAGFAVLADDGNSLDAVAQAVVVLEDSPHFNAGRGAVFNHDGINELDASIMTSDRARAGAVASLRRVRNPILLARAVMDHSPHVMLIGEGAEAFAREHDIVFVEPSYFRTEFRWQQLQDALAAEKAQQQGAAVEAVPSTRYFGTVGAVARDRAGRLAAATSTGGMTNKRWGRVGDAPIIGAGTYANAQCAVSGTGWGEFFIRAAVAHDICARVAYRGDSIRRAAEDVVLKKVPGLGGDGGVIAIDARGNVAMPFNTSGMYRGTIDRKGRVRIAIYRD